MQTVKSQIKNVLQHYDAAKVSALTASIIEPTTETELACQFFSAVLDSATIDGEPLLEAIDKVITTCHAVNDDRIMEHKIINIEPSTINDTASKFTDHAKTYNHEQIKSALRLCEEVINDVKQVVFALD